MVYIFLQLFSALYGVNIFTTVLLLARETAKINTNWKFYEMAAEVPVTDVLCEAMDYLAKLGTNLRTRSESLKEKRISKSKLKNSHAVQKAANKVLLICQLSRKSLDNVETGVRKVLALVDATQNAISDGGKSTQSTSKHRDIVDHNKYRFVEFKSKKLRVAKTVPLKHYMSVKVLAKNMPMSMQDEYPVFYDCKLYRLRKRKSALKKIKRIDSIEKISKKLSEVEFGEKKDEISEGQSMRQKERSYSSKSNNVISQSNLQNQEGNTSIGKSDAVTEKKETVAKPSTKNVTEDSILQKESDVSTEYETKSCASGTKETDSVTKEKEKERTNSEPRHSKESYMIHHRKRIKIVEDSSNSSAESAIKVSPEPVEEVDKNNKSISDSESCGKVHKSKKQKLNNTHSITEKRCDQILSLDSENSENKEANDNLSENSASEKSNTKPLIKCVSLCKLLKPEVLGSNHGPVLNKDSTKVTEGKSSPLKVKENNANELLKITKHSELGTKSSAEDKNKENKLNKNKYKKDSSRLAVQKNARHETSEQEIWEQKRKEVKEFKSRQFVINVLRLPKFTVNFLQDHHIKRIVQNNSVIFEQSPEISKLGIYAVGNNNSKNDSCHSQNSGKQKKASLGDDLDQSAVNKVKNALLNDSDSDVSREEHSSSNIKKNYKAKRNETDKRKDSASARNSDVCSEDSDVINVLAYESDLDIINNLELEKNSEEHDKNQTEDITKTTEQIKNALLNDSDSDKTDKDNIQSEKEETHSTNKPVLNTESENMKNALLNSDSETETQIGAEKDDKGNQNNENSCRAVDKNNDQTDTLQHSDNGSAIEQMLSNKLSKSNEDLSPGKNKKQSESSDADAPRTPLSKRRKRKQSTTPHSRRKHIMESMHAKKMLLNYSSSDTEDEQLKTALMDIKKDLLKGGSSDEENHKNSQNDQSPSSSSNDDIIHKVQNRMTKRGRDCSNNSQSELSNGDEAKDDTCNNQKDENVDENSDSSRIKMVRSKAKPGNCSSQNSDNQDTSDKDIDRLTNLNNLNTTHQRHESSSPEPTRTSRRKNKTAKALIGEELLKAESSDAASMADSDAEFEELPEVAMPSLNGSGIGHLAKDELLEESDSSATQEKDKSSEEFQNTEETDEENVKLRRRKALAISSDSEVGSSRRKEARVSDFEDSDDDGVEPVKKIKRKKRESDSDGSSSSNDGKKKRRRIKSVNDSDLSGSDSETEGRNKHGRKNIRKVMGKNQLEEATKKAARQEKERIARIAERQKHYNNLEFDESGKPDEVVLEKVVLDFDPETKEPLIEVDRGLVKKLKPHQANGIKFMWDACFESVKRIKKDRGSGCILAHCMGLGKTLQVVSLTHTLLVHGSLTGVNRVLVVCPLSTVLNWVNEFKMWLKHAHTDFEVDVYELSRYKQNSERAFQLQQWFAHGGVCVLGYEMFRNLSADNVKKYKKKMLRHFQESLVDPGPDLVVCDEGHLLKNEKTSLSQSMNRVKTLRRIVLTGTPLQNNLKEYYCMVQFVKPNLLGKYNEYLNRFVNPITNGQYTDSTEQDIRVMKRRSHVLHKMLDGAVQRRDYGVLAPFLPPKHEYVLFITLSEVQIKLYQFYLDNYSRRPLPGKSSGFLFPDFQSLQRIWTHPLVLKYNSERYEIMQQKKREREEEDSEGSLVDFIDDDSTPEESSTEDSTDSDSDISDDSRKKSKKKKSAKKGKAKDTRGSRRGTRANPVEIEEDDHNVAEVVEVKTENPTEWWIPLVTDDILEDLRNSHKLVLLFDILKHCEAIGDKLLVFSQSLYSLDLIEHFLGRVDEATQEARVDDKLGGHVGSWSPGIDYFRLDGSTSCENRSIWCKNFNREDNPRARLFLISTRAGGLGINLVAANRVVIFDVSWNPSHDVQSIFRVYRFGQKKPCYVYRFLAMGTMEEKIYERQVTKQAISKRVIDEQQIDRHYAENDLAELYKFEPQPPSPRPLPPLPKDRLFAEMLKEHEDQIYKYHEHDSLLENKEEETLSEEERKAAWEDFENEKTRPPPAPFPAPWPMHNGMVPGLVAQQQQQLAYATLAAMLRKDVPNISDNQIRDMLPLIYNSNPGMFGGYDYGLMQKLTDIYKYPQAGMMNPAMMNPAMNSGGVAGGGGSSGLQYEPPWQRQLQQQQQMRLQQLMQQQQSMGAKFYAGGLGSRDPVAMALQQQRAREIMVGGAGRPRGRPPLTPRLPAAPQDVVNLDSD